MVRAVRQVNHQMKSIISTTKDFNINYRTLTRYCHKMIVEDIAGRNVQPSIHVGYVKNRQILKNKQMEDQLADYIVRASDIYYGLSPNEIRKLAYQLAISNGAQLPNSWTVAELTSVEWFTAFLKRHPMLSISTPEATSLARSSSFNTDNVGAFSNNQRSVMTRHQFWAVVLKWVNIYV